MKKTSKWQSLGITKKFGLIFAIILLLVFFLGASAYLSLSFSINLSRQISHHNNIARHVIEMDRGMEKARRLHGDFFVQYQRVGLQQAHETYAQPSIREVSRVIALSRELQELLFGENTDQIKNIKRADVNLYLASAKRFAETSIQSMELISKRSAPTWGIEYQLSQLTSDLHNKLIGFPHLLVKLTETQLFFRDYLVTRKRHYMQSTLNSYHDILSSVEQEKLNGGKQGGEIQNNIKSIEELSEELLKIDIEIDSKLNDFSIQVETITPISESLVEGTTQLVDEAKSKARKAHITAIIIILASSISVLLLIVYIAFLVKSHITQNVLRLTKAARCYQGGQLDTRIHKYGGDELGQLAETFNNMAERIGDFIDNLETKVAQRTEQLALSEKRFKTLVNELPQIAVQGINEDLEVVYWNKTSSSLFSYSEKEVMGKRLEDLIFPAQKRKEVQKNFTDCFTDLRAPIIQEQVLIDKNGSEKTVFSAYETQVSSEDEKILYCVHLDLSELKLAQSRSQISELFYRQLFEHSSSGVVVYETVEEGRDFIFKDINPACEEIENIRKENVLGKSIKDIFPSVESFGLLELMRKAYKTGEPQHLPICKYNDDRIEGWRENRLYKLPTGEVVAVYNDMTRQKKAEDERTVMEVRLQRAQKMEAIGLMAGGIAHDLNNILTAMLGYPELLLLQLDEESELRKPIETIRDASERAAAVVADLLTVARGVASTRVPANINTLVKEYIESPEFTQLQKVNPNIQFTTQYDPKGGVVNCSPVHVKKSIMNIALNAVEAIDGQGEVSIRTEIITPDEKWIRENGLEEGTYVKLTISDNGSGISAIDIEHIFEPFYTKKVMGKRSGTGLGLSVVWNTVKEHNGTVLVNSSNSGTVFELFFPVVENAMVPLDLKVSLDQLRGNGEKILVVDDEQVQCDLAISMLNELGYKADSVTSGENAVEYLQQNEVDLVLLDMLMDPGMNGRQTHQKIRQFKPDQKALIVSGFSEGEDVRETIKSGAAGYIKKPYRLSSMGSSIKKALSDI